MDDDLTLAYYYFDFRNKAESVEAFLRSITRQLWQNLGIVSPVARRLEHYRSSNNSIPLSELTTTIKSLVQGSQRKQVYIVIDALDECGDHSSSQDLSSVRKELLRSVQILRSIEGMHLLVTSKDGQSPDQIDYTL